MYYNMYYNQIKNSRIKTEPFQSQISRESYQTNPYCKTKTFKRKPSFLFHSLLQKDDNSDTETEIKQVKNLKEVAVKQIHIEAKPDVDNFSRYENQLRMPNLNLKVLDLGNRRELNKLKNQRSSSLSALKSKNTDSKESKNQPILMIDHTLDSTTNLLYEHLSKKVEKIEKEEGQKVQGGRLLQLAHSIEQKFNAFKPAILKQKSSFNMPDFLDYFRKFQNREIQKVKIQSPNEVSLFNEKLNLQNLEYENQLLERFFEAEQTLDDLNSDAIRLRNTISELFKKLEEMIQKVKI